jgi:hypothetical protein
MGDGLEGLADAALVHAGAFGFGGYQVVDDHSTAVRAGRDGREAGDQTGTS